MSLKQLRSHLMRQDYRQTVLADLPPDNTPDFVKATLDAANRRYAREARKEEKKRAKAARAAANEKA